jgi:Kef-type K+ transport system membrane component KefB
MSGFLLAANGDAALPEGAVVLKELTTEHNIAWVIIDVVIILAVARVVGALFRRIGQPPVIGEILAGLIMGPLVLGSSTVTDLFGLDTSISDTLFPADARPFLKVLAELGLVIFMFVVGLELDMKLIKGKERLAAGVSLTSVLLPFSLGFGLASLIRDDYLPPGIDFLPFALFIGASMSVTAFPVLARILTERRMTGTPVGAVSLACAAIDDILAWSLLALVTAVIESTSGDGGGSPAADLGRVVGLTLLFGIFMSIAVKPLLGKLNDRYRRDGLTPDILAVVLGLLLVASWTTSHIGIHSIFGAFMLGVVFPREGASEFTHAILEKIESVAVLLLLPLFFIVTGLNAKIPAGVRLGEFLKLLGMILVVACVGKFVGATVAGRVQGMSWRRSAAIGTLMNTRGLTELVLLSIGLDKGVLNGTMFTALVLMAIITTVMTSPLLNRIYPERMVEHDIAEAERAALGDAIAFRVLVAIDDPTRAEPVVDLACGIARAQPPAEVVLTNFEEQRENATGRELSSFLDTIAGELDTMHGLEERVRAQGLAVRSFSQRTTSLAADIAAQAQRMGVRLVVVGDRRDDPAWVATVGELVALGPADVGIVVAPLPRTGSPVGNSEGPPVIEVGEGPAGLAALEYGVRLAVPAGTAPTIVGLGSAGRAAKRYGAVVERLAGLGRSARTEDAGLATPEGAALVAGAAVVVRPFAGPEGLEPVQRARPDAERFGCPVLLVAPDPNQLERSGLDALLAETTPLTNPVD